MAGWSGLLVVMVCDSLSGNIGGEVGISGVMGAGTL